MSSVRIFASAEIEEEGLRIVQSAGERRLVLRILGAVAFSVHCRESSPLYQTMGRELSDLDFAAYSRQSDEIVRLLEEMDYSLDRHHAAYHPGRHVLYKENSNLKTDIFYENLEMCHKIDFGERLEVDTPTIPLAEMLLEKMQIVQITHKDVIDTIILLRTHEIGDIDKETINCAHIGKVLSDDWGFFYTVTTNLVQIRDNFLPTVPSLTEEDRNIIKSRIDKIFARIEKQPKSLRWKIRAQLGTRKAWYNEVEDLTR